MAFHVHETEIWQAGAGSPVKYTFTIDANLMVEDILYDDGVAVININGYIYLENHPTNSRNSFAASDFAYLFGGYVDISTHPWVNGTYYYQYTLPYLPDPQNDDVEKILAEFRGDTWRNDPVNSNNRVSLWAPVPGLVYDQYSQEGTVQYHINYSYEVPLPTGGNNAPILTWATTGCGSSTDYTWLHYKTWATWFDLDYRPGATLKNNKPYYPGDQGGVWRSHNRTNGAAHVLSATDPVTWQECRTINGESGGQGNPPLILHQSDANSWYNQKKLGKAS